MDFFLRGYSLNGPTWFCLSLLLTTMVFFRCNRVWSLRNFDLVLLLSISTGLLIVKEDERLGYTWLLVGTALFLLRLLGDPLFKYRSWLEQNLNFFGLVFLGVATFAFLTIKVVTERLPDSTLEVVDRANRLLNLEAISADATVAKDSQPDITPGPASSLIVALVIPLSKGVVSSNTLPVGPASDFRQISAWIVVILAHFAVVCGLVLMGRQHFEDVRIGVGMATLYLLLPSTVVDVGQVSHVLSAALIVWAFVAYRRPVAAGGMLGLASGTLFFSVFILPLWALFYTRRRAIRFGLTVGGVAVVLLGSLWLTSENLHSFVRQIANSINWNAWISRDSAYIIPVGVAFLVLLIVLSVWPRRKNLEHLLSHSAAIATAVVLATQFWQPKYGGVYMLWCLPLFLMVVFRPRLTYLLPQQLRSPKVAEP